MLADLLDDEDEKRLDRSVLLELSRGLSPGAYPEDLPEPTADQTRHLVNAATSVANVAAALLSPTTGR